MPESNGGRSQREEASSQFSSASTGSRRRSAETPLRFIDLFCGIGGFRLAFERTGCRCASPATGTSSASRPTLPTSARPARRHHSVAVADIPKFDILCGGFPCQPFSLAGVSTAADSLGRKHGFADEKQGNLFFSIPGKLMYRPPAFVLENVNAPRPARPGPHVKIIHDTLTRRVGYQVYWPRAERRRASCAHGRERTSWSAAWDVPLSSRTCRRAETRQHPRPRRAGEIPRSPITVDYALQRGEPWIGFTATTAARTLSARYHNNGSEILYSQNCERIAPPDTSRMLLS